MELNQTLILLGADFLPMRLFSLGQHKMVGAWIVGLGSRFIISQHLSLGLEYQLLFFDSISFNLKSEGQPYGPDSSWQVNADSRVKVNDLISSRTRIQLIYFF